MLSSSMLRLLFVTDDRDFDVFTVGVVAVWLILLLSSLLSLLFVLLKMVDIMFGDVGVTAVDAGLVTDVVVSPLML